MSKKKTLVIVESPTKCHKIQEYLGDDYIVAASKGHIADLRKGGKFGLGIDIEDNFKPHYVLMEDKVAIVQELMELAKECKAILLGSDNDREGNSIAWHIQQRLVDLNKPMKRMTFNEIKKTSLLKSIQNAGDLDMNSVHSQEARRMLDRIVGFMASSYLMNTFEINSLSAGRVQSVVSRMVIDRETEINSFIPETFFTIQANLSQDNKIGFITKYSKRLTDEKIAKIIKDKLNTTNAEFIVSEVSAEEELKYPQPPLITSTLQRLMSKEHGISAEQTSKIAQTLYEQGFITYIRTDSVRVGEEPLQELRQWIEDNNYTLPKKSYNYKNKDAAQNAHECIRPTDITLIPSNNFAMINPDEKLLYEVVWKYFVASQMMPAVYNTLKLTLQLKSDPSIELKATGKALKTPGFLEILGITDNSTIDLPFLQQGDICKHFGKAPIKMDKKQTQPPPRYSEDKLLKELENKGIGRPSTYGELLSKITTRNYVEKKGSVFHPTDLGKKVVQELTQFFTFMDYNYTKDLETKLDLIMTGKLDHITMLKEFYPKFKQELDQAYLQHGNPICEKCNNPMVKRKGKNGMFLACSNFPSCYNTKNINNQHKTIAQVA